jgi:hypothetical protein
MRTEAGANRAKATTIRRTDTSAFSLLDGIWPKGEESNETKMMVIGYCQYAFHRLLVLSRGCNLVQYRSIDGKLAYNLDW